ncbi:hypothetical protein [Dactylosporangium salmoneum]|uniref:HEAT repeat domain-containing protein n=1 Tax=Dactylosporangium salmoneum TaxID=53361 RepID=A0ABN3I6K5_9ACTN
MDSALTDLLAELAPGRDGRRAFAALERQMFSIERGPARLWLVRRLYELASAPDNGNRPLLVRLIARIAWSHRHTWAPDRSPAVGEQLRDGLPALTTFVADADPLVRRVAPYAICEIVTGESGLAWRIRDQAAVEEDPPALAGQIRALDELGHAPAPGSTPAPWFASWLRHPSPVVRLAAIGALARRGAGLGEHAADVLSEDPQPWGDSPWRPRGGPSSTVRWLARRLAEHPDEGERPALAAFTSNAEEARRGASGAAATVLNRWRRPMPRLWAALAAALSDPSTLVAQLAAEVLATGGEAVRPYTGQLLAATERDEPMTALHAAAALAGLGDAGAVPRLASWISGRCYWPLTIAAAELLTPFPQLLPTIRDAVGHPASEPAPLLSALAAWGPASAAAVPELVALLDTVHAARVCVTLGHIGPDARPAADALDQLATGRRRPPSVGRARSPEWHGTQDAAWAHWRVTGDPRVALVVLGRAVRRGPGQAMLPFLADLGPLAAGHAGDVRRLLEFPGDWNRVEAAHAWWRITGDPAPAIPVLLAAIEPLRTRRTSAVVRAAVRYLGAIGPRAGAALPILEAALAGDERLIDSHARHPILADEALVRDARAALGRIRPE